MSFINEKPNGKFNHFNHVEKNEILLKTNAVKTCSEYCFKNLKTDFVINDENICLTRCFRKYLDSTYLGEQIYDSIAQDKLKTDLVMNGNFADFSADVKTQFNL